jgi:hypothetical protein
VKGRGKTLETLLVYRVCGRQEVRMLQIGEHYRLGQPPAVRSTQPGLHATLVPEYWRRILNRQMANLGLGFRYTHSLLLEIPADTQASHKPVYGLEYRIEDPRFVIVRGIADDRWPPAWLPQPARAIEWEPNSTHFHTSVIKWQPLVSPTDWRDNFLSCSEMRGT